MKRGRKREQNEVFNIGQYIDLYQQFNNFSIDTFTLHFDHFLRCWHRAILISSVCIYFSLFYHFHCWFDRRGCILIDLMRLLHTAYKHAHNFISFRHSISVLPLFDCVFFHSLLFLKEKRSESNKIEDNWIVLLGLSVETSIPFYAFTFIPWALTHEKFCIAAIIEVT